MQRKTPVLESLFNKLAGLQLYQKETPTQVFSCKYYEIFKNTSGGCFKVIIVNARNTLQSRKFRRNFYISHILSILSNSYNSIKRT